VFIRNGKEHNSTAARDHLQMKRKRGKRYYSNTEEFIDRIASQSSWTGRDYQIRCGKQQAVSAKSWFTSLLEGLRKSHAASRTPDNPPEQFE
jgi:hypothetical protein